MRRNIGWLVGLLSVLLMCVPLTAQQTQAAGEVQTFELPAAAEGQRATAPLKGTWEVAFYTDPEIEQKKPLPNRTAFITDIAPLGELKYAPVAVPHNFVGGKGPQGWAHTAVYRTRVNVPAGSGRAYVLRLPSFNLIASVLVNGQFCGGSRNAYAIFDCDITKAVKPGQMNELTVVIKDVWYALSPAEKDAFIMTVPPTLFQNHSQGVTMSCDFPVATRPTSGLLETPELICTGEVYTADVFAIPSVKNKSLGLEITLNNSTQRPAKVTVENSVVALDGQTPELTLPPSEADVPAGESKLLTLKSPADLKLWWPHDPQQYNVLTTLKVNGKVVDTKQTKFGFREWEWTGIDFKLNGIRWHLRADTYPGKADTKAAVETMKKHGQTMWRFWGSEWNGLDQRQALDLMDAGGMPVRRSGVFDGEFASYNWWDKNPNLWDNWRSQLLAQIKGERNHPSIFIWSIENEVTFINSRNLGKLKLSDPEIKKAAAEVMKTDPTRPVMVDGGNTLLDNSLPVNGVHYVDAPWNTLPDAAATLDWIYSTKTPWVVARNKPILLGEAFYARGNAPGDFAQVIGEEAFLGRGYAKYGVDLIAKMYSEGHRFTGVAPHYWLYEGELSYYNSWQPIAVLVREWDRTFPSGATIKRSFGVFNDNSPTAKKIDVRFEVKTGEKSHAVQQASFDVPAGRYTEGAVELQLPAVEQRTAGEIVITASVDGKQVWQDRKPIALLPVNVAAKPELGAGKLALLDRSGKVRAHLQKRGIQFQPVTALTAIPANVQVLVIGPNSLTAEQAKNSQALQQFAARGRRLLILEQETPLAGQAFTGAELSDKEGRVAFAQAISHPIFAGLQQEDLAFWTPDHVTYNKAFKKLPAGANSLVQCGSKLSETCVASLPVSKGLIVVSQMAIGGKLDKHVVAQQLFDNMLNYAAGYELVERSAAIVMDAASEPAKLLQQLKVRGEQVNSVAAALSGKNQIIIVDATPANLKTLADSADQVKAFTSKGGWIMLWGLTPEGLDSFNRLVGVNHVIRPFEMERVTLPRVRDALTAGLTMRDVTMEGAAMHAHAGDKFAAGDVFTYVVDYDEIGPFCQLPDPIEYFKMVDPKPGFDHWPRNIFNGFTTEDSWKYVLSINTEANQPVVIPMTLPREETITQFTVQFNALYRKTTKFKLTFDDGESITFNAEPTNDRQEYKIEPARKAKKLTLELLEWTTESRTPVVGVDNVWIYVQRDDAFRKKVAPLLNIGAIVKYPMGEGGVVLNNLRLTGDAKNANEAKKRNIAQTILRNMGAVFETK